MLTSLEKVAEEQSLFLPVLRDLQYYKTLLPDNVLGRDP